MHSEQDIQKIVKEAVQVRREDIAQAKQVVMKDTYSGTDGFVQRWFQSLKLSKPSMVVSPSPEFQDTIGELARCYSLQMALYQAVWELVASGEIVPLDKAKEWVPEITYRLGNMTSTMRFDSLKTYYVPEIHRLPRSQGLAVDADIFLQGIDSRTLHSGIREAVEQALGCFRRGLYMPATAMIAAAVEGTWTECGTALATKLANTKLEGVVGDQFASIGRIVVETRKALEALEAKPMLKAAGQSLVKVNEAEQWTTVIRDRRNALHWGKAKSFITDHSGTASLLMGAPQHIGTLEAIRAAC